MSIFWKAQKTAKKVTQKAGFEKFHLNLWIFFIPNSFLNAWIFCFAILSSNLSGRFMHLLRRYMHLLTFIVNKTSSVYRYAAFPVAMLYNLSLSVWLNGFIIWNRFITPCRRYYETSSFFFSSSISNDDVIIVICKKWDSAHVCLAEIGLVIYVMPNWLLPGWSAPELDQLGYWRKIFHFALFQTIILEIWIHLRFVSSLISQAISYKSNDSSQTIC